MASTVSDDDFTKLIKRVGLRSADFYDTGTLFCSRSGSIFSLLNLKYKPIKLGNRTIYSYKKDEVYNTLCDFVNQLEEKGAAFATQLLLEIKAKADKSIPARNPGFIILLLKYGADPRVNKNIDKGDAKANVEISNRDDKKVDFFIGSLFGSSSGVHFRANAAMYLHPNWTKEERELFYNACKLYIDRIGQDNINQATKDFLEALDKDPNNDSIMTGYLEELKMYLSKPKAPPSPSIDNRPSSSLKT